MLSINNFSPIAAYIWELPVSYRADMRVPVRVFASEAILQQAFKDKAIEQAVNASTLPGLVGWVAVMPDVHQGYGFPIGGVAAADMRTGVISPGGIGYDINCGVRLAASHIPAALASEKLDALINRIYQVCPSGVGGKGGYPLTESELDAVCVQGARWALGKGFATAADVDRTEDGGCLQGADPRSLSPRARERGRQQLGSLGSGNHFIEIQVVESVYDPAACQAMGLVEGCLAVLIHTGSRGFGHQICTEHVRVLQGAVGKYNISIPDRELVCAPIQSQEGQTYLMDMRCAANYAFVNRQLLLHGVRQAFEQVFAGLTADWQLAQVYDITHNIGKVEAHTIAGKKYDVCVHRKGATRSFGPGAPGLPAVYQKIGQPVLIPGSMGTSSWVLRGTERSMQLAFGSCAHGAGRLLSRAQAKKQIWGADLKEQLLQQGIHVRAGSLSGLAEEAPAAYKDVDLVIESAVGAGLAEKVARLRPLAVVKG